MLEALSVLLLLACSGGQEAEKVDLLSLVDAVKGASGGSWTKNAEGLFSPGRPFSRVRVPFAPPEEYDITAVAERRGESNSLNLGLAVGDVQFLVILDAFFGGEYLSGIELIDGKPFMSNETTVKGAFFAPGVPSTVVCSVRKNRVTVTVDGKKAVDWKADYRRLSLMQGWGVGVKNCLLVGSWTSVVRIRSLELTPVSGTGRRLVDPPPPPPSLESLGPEEVDARLRPLIERLDAESFVERNAAQEELDLLPLRWLPRLHALAAAKESQEVRLRLAAVGIPAAWAPLLRGTLREARDTLRILEGNGAAKEKARQRLMTDALEIPPAEAVAAFLSLLDAQSPALQDLGLAGLALLPGPASARAVDFLDNPGLASQAADVLLAAGNPAVVPKVLDVFRAGASPQAARVLMLLDPLAAVDDALVHARKASPPIAALRLLAKGGQEAALIELLAGATSSDRDGIARALAQAGGTKAVEALRASFRKDPDDDLRDELFASLRDPAWAAERLEEGDVAASAGPPLRERVLQKLATPGLSLGERRRLLPLLGAVGSPEDGALLRRALGDPRVAAAAAEGLDRLGDPAHAAAVLDLWKRSDPGIPLGAIFAAPPEDALEADLAEVLSDPEGYDGKWFDALRLAERRWSPRTREALGRGLLVDGLDWRGFRLRGLQSSVATIGASDDPWIAKLRTHAEPAVKQYGLLLATARGDAPAAAELARAWASEPRPPSYKPFGSDRLAMMDLVLPPAWKDAVAVEWRRRPGWDDGAAWLASRGDPEALTHVLERLELMPDYLRRWFDAKLAAKGDVAALRRLLQRVLGHLQPAAEEEAAFAAGATPEWRARVLAHARLALRAGTEPLLRLAALAADARGVGFCRQLIAEGRTGKSAVACIESLGRLQAREAAVDLREQLRSRDPACRAAAARALGAIGDRASIPFVARLLEDPAFDGERPAPRRVWQAAIDALETLDGLKTEGVSTAERRAFWRSRHAGGK